MRAQLHTISYNYRVTYVHCSYIALQLVLQFYACYGIYCVWMYCQCHSLQPLLIIIVTSTVYLYLYIIHYLAPPPLMLECSLSLRDLTRTPDHNQPTPPSWMLSSSHSNADKKGTSLPSTLTSPLSPLHRGTRLVGVSYVNVGHSRPSWSTTSVRISW